MKYYVVASYSGTMDEIPAHDTLESAIKTRDEWNKEDGKDFWKVVDENGNEVTDD